MTELEFVDEAQRIRAVYGEKAFGPERAQIFFARFRGLSLADWRKLADFMIAEHTLFPALSRWESACSQIVVAATAEPKVEYPACELCGATGAVIARRRGTAYEFTFRCSCAAGAAARYTRIRTWSPDLIRAWAPLERNPTEAHNRDNPDPVEAKRLADKYAPATRALIARAFPPLPYDKKQRIESEYVPDAQDLHALREVPF